MPESKLVVKLAVLLRALVFKFNNTYRTSNAFAMFNEAESFSNYIHRIVIILALWTFESAINYEADDAVPFLFKSHADRQYQLIKIQQQFSFLSQSIRPTVCEDDSTHGIPSLGCSEKAKESFISNFTAFVDVMQCEMDLEISDLSG